MNFIKSYSKSQAPKFFSTVKNGNHRDVYFFIASWNNSTAGNFFLANETIQYELDISNKTVSQALKALMELGYITRVSKGNNFTEKSSRYIVKPIEQIEAEVTLEASAQPVGVSEPEVIAEQPQQSTIEQEAPEGVSDDIECYPTESDDPSWIALIEQIELEDFKLPWDL